MFRNGLFTSAPARSTGGFFSDIHYENLVALQEVKLTQVCLCVWGGRSPSVASLWSFCQWDLSKLSLQQFVGCNWGFPIRFCSFAWISCSSPCSPACLYSLGGEGALIFLMTLLLWWIWSYWYFSSFSLLLIVRTEGWLPNFFHVGWEMFPSIFSLLKSVLSWLYVEFCQILSFCRYWEDYVVFNLYSLICFITLTDFFFFW